MTVVQPNEDGSYWRKIVRNKMVTQRNATQRTCSSPEPQTLATCAAHRTHRTAYSIKPSLTPSQLTSIAGAHAAGQSVASCDPSPHVQVRMKESRRVKAAKAWMGEMVGDDKVGSVL